MAPGVNVSSLSTNNGYTRMSGTSVATPFVTGTIALLWSLYPNAASNEIIYSLMGGDSLLHRKRIIPPLLNAEKSLKILERIA